MKFGTITSRRCRRCGKVGTSQLPNTSDNKAANTHLLCGNCLKWQKNNPTKTIR